MHLTILHALLNHLSQLQLLKRLLEPVFPPINFVLAIVCVLFAIEVDGEHILTCLLAIFLS